MARSNVFVKLPDNWIEMNVSSFGNFRLQLIAFGTNLLPGINLQHIDYIEFNKLVTDLFNHMQFAMAMNQTTIRYSTFADDLLQAKLRVDVLARTVFDLKEQLQFESEMEVRFWNGRAHTNGF